MNKKTKVFLYFFASLILCCLAASKIIGLAFFYETKDSYFVLKQLVYSLVFSFAGYSCYRKASFLRGHKSDA